MGRDLRQGSFCRILQCFNSRARMGRDSKFRRPTCLKPRFQFTRPHGARPPLLPTGRPQSTCFNSRARMGRDAQFARGSRYSKVSIHAPAWGATSCPIFPRNLNASFNSRARMGRDLWERVHPRQFVWFQFTRPHGARLAVQISIDAGANVSIHAPAWGAT